MLAVAIHKAVQEATHHRYSCTLNPTVALSCMRITYRQRTLCISRNADVHVRVHMSCLQTAWMPVHLQCRLDKDTLTQQKRPPRLPCVWTFCFYMLLSRLLDLVSKPFHRCTPHCSQSPQMPKYIVHGQYACMVHGWLSLTHNIAEL